MAVILVLQGENGLVRPGDAVFDYEAGRDYELHVGVFIGARQSYPSSGAYLEVSGIPGHSGGSNLDVANWGSPGEYHADIIGQRLDADESNIKQVALLSLAVMAEHSQLGTRCTWKRRAIIDSALRIRDGIPLFKRGTCAQFVEYLYENSGFDLIQQEITFDPMHPHRLYPASQIHVFWSGKYSLQSAWDKSYERYPECLFGARSLKS
jgi:hypothetical protein